MTQIGPYFYIIKHKPTGKLYAGCRWASGCSQEELLKKDGYQTSSNTIKFLIKRDGLDSFDIKEIKSEADCGMPVRDYETKFLTENNISKSENWLNSHNNNSTFSFGTSEFKKLMKVKYGTDYIFNLDEYKQKRKETWIKNYGEDHPSKNIQFRFLKKENHLKEYGVDHPWCRPEIRENIKATMLEIYGGTGHQSSYISNKIKQTLFEKYGVEHNMKNPETRKKAKATHKERYGVENPSQTPETKLKKIETCRENFGVDHPMQSNIVQNKIKASLMEKYGVDNPAKMEKSRNASSKRMKIMQENAPIYTCPHCNKTIKGKLNSTRWHFDNCKMKSTLSI